MLTATQKIQLHEAHANYMVAECGTNPYDAADAGRKASVFCNLINELGLTRREAEVISWEVHGDHDAILLEAIKEGYTNEYLTPETISYLEGAR